MKKLIYTMIGGLLLGMTISLSHVSLFVTTEAKPYYDKFVSIAKDCGEPINIGELRIEVDYSLTKKEYYAITYTELNLIVIKYNNYMRLSEMQQEQTIIHELGHALLDLRHDDDDLNIMNTYGWIDEKDYIDNYDYYIRKMFIDCKRKEKFIYE